MQLFLIGPSGSGKDTQAKLLAEHYHLHWVSIGEVLRKRALITDEFGTIIKNTIDSGELLSWEYLKTVMQNEIELYPNNFIWTGFPRVLEQAKEFDETMKHDTVKLELVINLNISDELTQQRIFHRKNVNVNVREDDKNESLVQKRIDWYKNNISQIKEYYINSNRLVEVDGSRSIREVFHDIVNEIDKRVHS